MIKIVRLLNVKYKIVILNADDFEGTKILSTIRNEITYENAVSFSIGENFDVTEYHILIDRCAYDIADICGGYIYNDIYIYTRNKNVALKLVNDFIGDDVDVIIQ